VESTFVRDARLAELNARIDGLLNALPPQEAVLKLAEPVVVPAREVPELISQTLEESLGPSQEEKIEMSANTVSTTNNTTPTTPAVAADAPGFLAKVGTQLGDEALKATPRVLAQQLLKTAKIPMIALLSKQMPQGFLGRKGKAFRAFLSKPAGEGMLAFLISGVLELFPMPGVANDMKQAIASELRIHGMTLLGMLGMDVVLEPLRQVLANSLGVGAVQDVATQLASAPQGLTSVPPMVAAGKTF
jgi:hypothetical protein